MSDSNKSFPPTPKRIEDKRREGSVAQSKHLATALVACAVIFIFFMKLETGMAQFKRLMLYAIHGSRQDFMMALKNISLYAAESLAMLIAPILLISVITKIIVSWLQFGIVITTEKIAKLESLNPVTHLKQMFGVQQLSNLLINVIAAALLAMLIYIASISALNEILSLANTRLDNAWRSAADIFKTIAIPALLFLVVLGLIDLTFQKYFYLKNLRMSFEEIKAELKDTQGSPEIKSKRKDFGLELIASAGNSHKRVRSADALVVNPTHYAVALHYREEDTPLPVIIACGVDKEAQEMIETARHAGIPVIRYIWLARLLYATGENEYVPRQSIREVAAVYKVLDDIKEDQEKPIDWYIEIESVG